jgi:hypothetical protein
MLNNFSSMLSSVSAQTLTDRVDLYFGDEVTRKSTYWFSNSITASKAVAKE